MYSNIFVVVSLWILTILSTFSQLTGIVRAEDEDSFYYTDTHRSAVFRMSLQGGAEEKIPIRMELKNPIAIGFDERTNDLFFTERGSNTTSSKKFLLRYNPNEGVSTKYELPRGSTPDGLAVDSISGLIFLADAGHKEISAFSRNLLYRTSIINTGLDQPRGLAVNPFKGWLYWSDWSATSAHIGRAYMDGSGRRALIHRDIGWPNGMTLDLENHMLYWADASLGRIERCDEDGHNRQTLLPLAEAKFFGIVVDEQYIYWTQWDHGTIRRMSKDGGSQSFNDVGVAKENVRLNGLVLVKRSRFISNMGKNACFTQNGGCQHLCIPMGEGTRVCRCNEGHVLKPDSTACRPLYFHRAMIVTDSQLQGVYLIDLVEHASKRLGLFGFESPRGVAYDKSEQKIFIVDTGKRVLSGICFDKVRVTCIDTVHRFPNGSIPEYIALDPETQRMFVTDSGMKRIWTVSYSGQVGSLVDTGDKPRAIAWHRGKKTLFWSEWGTDPKIIKYDPNTGTKADFVVTNLVWPNGIVIDETAQKLYWTDGKLSRLERIDLDERNRELLLSGNNINYFAITLSEDHLYWTATNSRSYYSMPLSDTTQVTEHEEGLVRNALGIFFFANPVEHSHITPAPKGSTETTTQAQFNMPSGGDEMDNPMGPFDPNGSSGGGSHNGPFAQPGEDSSPNHTIIISASVVAGGVVIAIIAIVVGVICYKKSKILPTGRDDNYIEPKDIYLEPQPTGNTEQTGLYSHARVLGPPSDPPPDLPDVTNTNWRQLPDIPRSSAFYDDVNLHDYETPQPQVRPPIPLPPSVYTGLQGH